MTYELWIGNEVLAYGYSEDALRAFIATTGYEGIVYNSSGFDVTAAFIPSKKRKPTCHASPSGRHSKAKDTYGLDIPWCEWCSAQIIRRA